MIGSVLICFLAAASPGTAQTQTATAKPGTVVLTIVSETGQTLGDATVRMSGSVDRGGTTGANGVVTFDNVPAGTFRARITRDGSVTLEKEIVVRAGVKSAVEAVLTAAPPPPPAPPPPAPTPVVVASTLKAGDPRILSLPTLIEQMLKEKDPNVERDLGCSGATASRLILARENIALHRHAEVDEVLYVVAGEALLALSDKDQAIEAGWYALVPRGMSHSITRKGRTPLVLLSVQSGQPCK